MESSIYKNHTNGKVAVQLVTYVNKVTSWVHPYIEYHGLSTDTKPTDATDNSKFVELDTGAEYYYSGGEWNLAPTQDGGGSDGGSSSGTGAFLAEITTQDFEEFTLVTPPSEVFAAAQEGPVTAIVELSDSELDQIVRMDLTFAVDYTVTEGHAIYTFCFNGSGVDGGHDLSIVFEGAVDDGVNTAGIEPEPSGGSSSISYNDLLDRPFYEETVANPIRYTIPHTDGTSYDYTFGTTIEGETCQVYLYKVTTHPMTASELAGCSVTVYQSDGYGKDMMMTETIQSATTAVDGNDSVVGRYFMPNDIPYVIVADDNGNDINIPNAFNAKSLDVGTYLVYVDTGAITSETHIYAYDIHRDAQTVVHKLNEKFYDKGASKFVVTLTDDKGSLVADYKIDQVVAAKEAGNIVVCLIELEDGYTFELPCVFGTAFNDGGSTINAVIFSGIGYVENATNIVVFADDSGGSDTWVMQTSRNGECVPDHSAIHNGKVLGVDNGYLAWVTPSGGAEKFVVTVTADDSGAETVWTADKTIAEIVEAYDAGANVVCSYPTEGGSYELPCIYAAENGESPTTFNAVMFSANIIVEGIEAAAVTGYEDEGSDVWAAIQTPIEALPSHTSANNGQVLGVSSGDLAWVTPESGITSWNDLEDKPFYEETVSVAINYTNPYIDGANADKVVDASYLNTPVPISLYRVGDALTAAQLDGATMDLIYNNGTDARTGSITLTSANITSVQNGRYVMFEGLPYLVVADVDNTTIEIPNCGQFTSLDAGTYLEYIDMGNFSAGSYYIISSITKDGVTAIHKLDEKFYNGGVSSWNDLADRPFYETVTAAGYNFEIDLDDPNYVSGYFDIGEDVSAKFYRVGDPLTAAQLVGAMGTVNTNGENNSRVIKSDYIEEIEDNGDTVGLFVADDMPYALVINKANTTIDVDATNDRPFGCSGTFASTGTYLCWIDLSTMEEGMSAYNPSLIKADNKTVTQLPEQYYKAPFVVTADLDLSQTSVSNVSAPFADILTAIQSGRVTSLVLEFYDGYNDVQAPLYPSIVTSAQIHFSATAPYSFGGVQSLYTFHVYINADEGVYSTFYLHNATAQ